MRRRLVEERVLEELGGGGALLFVLDEALADEIGEVGGPLGAEGRDF